VHRFVSARVIAVTFLALPLPERAQPVEGDPASGRSIAEALQFMPSRAVATLRRGRSCEFQSVADLPSTTGMSLNVFQRPNHNNMPDLVLSGSESKDVIAHILSLKRK
jgi:hypothetical protein